MEDSSVPLTVPPMKPFDTYYRLTDILKPNSSCSEYKDGSIICTSQIDSVNVIQMIPYGYCSLHRCSDGLMTFSSQPPIILGLSELFDYQERFYLKTLAPVDIHTIPVSKAIDIINDKNLWRDVAEILAYHTELWAIRDASLTGVDSYTSVKELLYEYLEQPAIVRHQINTATFIRERTGLSRSLVLKILSDLRKGGFIAMHKGRLLDIIHLPERW